MNRACLTGRLTKDPSIKYTAEQMCIARFTLAVNRRGKDKEADFISCVAFGKTGEFCEKYAKKGMKFDVVGHIQTGSYEKDGKKVYTTDVVVDEIQFGESKEKNDGWEDVPDDTGLPFN